VRCALLLRRARWEGGGERPQLSAPVGYPPFRGVQRTEAVRADLVLFVVVVRVRCVFVLVDEQAVGPAALDSPAQVQIRVRAGWVQDKALAAAQEEVEVVVEVVAAEGSVEAEET
jgi:hypothetical protein